MAVEIASQEQLVKLLKARPSTKGGRIGFAVDAIGQIAKCFDGSGYCPTKLFNLNSEEQWKVSLKAAEDTLVYHHPRMKVKSIVDDVVDMQRLAEDAKAIEDCCCVFDCVLTTNDQDRDNDILEPGGAVIDSKMPLLWQHSMLAPIGKLLKVVSKSPKRIVTRFAIIDTELGRDAARLLKFGCLRISQGFKPKEWAAIYAKGMPQTDDNVVGFHIKSYETVEGSLVSIPSLRQAEVLGHVDKFNSPVVKSFIKTFYANEGPPPAAAAADPVSKRVADALSAAVSQLQPAAGCGCADKAACTCGAKAPAPGTTKDGGGVRTKQMHGMVPLAMPPVEGSWEDTCCQLEMAAGEFLEDLDLIDPWESVMLIATWPDRGILCNCDPWGGRMKACYEVAWSMQNGVPTWTGDPKEIEITSVIRQRADEMMQAKAALGMIVKSGSGRAAVQDVSVKGRLAKKHQTKIMDANHMVRKVHDTDPGMEMASKTLLNKSNSLLDEVLADVGEAADETDKKEPSIDELGRKLMAAMVIGDRKAVDEAAQVHEQLGVMLRAARKQAAAAELEAYASQLLKT